MNTYHFLKDLLTEAEAYERENKGASTVENFARWLLRTTPQLQEGGVNDFELHRIGQLVVYLQRYAKGYTRKALEGTPLNSDDELVYLIVLHYGGPISKTALIHENRHEKPTGMDIIRRLVKAGYIEQYDNPEDGRSKLLRITDLGRALVQKLQPRLDFISELITGNLNPQELSTLLYLLEKLEQYHQVILAKTKGGDFADLIRAAKSNSAG